MKDIFSKEIIAIIPTYLPDRGNCTRVYTDREELIINMTIKTVIKRLCAHHRLDLRASNRHFGGLISIKNAIPIPLSKDNILIQGKVRKPIGKDDGCMGYFNLNSIKKVKALKNDTLIILDNGVEIQCICSPDTIKRHMNHGELIKKLYEDRQPIVSEAMEYYVASDTPATKSDIARIFMMIQEIVHKIN